MDYDRSVYYLKRSINQNKNSSMAFHNLANTQRSIGKYNEAIIFYKKALEIKPAQIESINGLGLTYYDLLQNKSVIECFKSILEIDKKNYQAKRNLAIGYVKTGYIKKAIELFKEILEKLPNCITSINHLIQLSSYDKNLDINNLSNKLLTILSTEKLNFKKNKTQIISLLGFGRSGSLFLHSLLDGHPQISTLPGYFFKGWFSENTWPILQPNFEDINWRETLVEKICTHFEPQFNAHCKRNVIGEPNGNTEWFAKNLGFTQLGENHSEVLELDQQKFKSKFIDLSQKYDEMDSRICFELIHKAFDKAYRIPENSSQRDKIIFYHLHNPSYFERANFVCNYPSAKFLYVIRNPIQMLESWIAGYINKINKTTSSFQNKIYFNLIVKRITRVFHYMYDPFNDLFETRGVKLEDIKRNYQDLIPNLKNWIGVDYHTALEKSEFLNSKFSRPSASMDMISGFDTRSIDIKIGRFFSNRDIEILETLFWPFMKLYGYTEVSEKDFHQNLKKIKPLISEPLDIEINYFTNFENNNINIKETSSFKLLHQNLLNAWNTLDQNMTYPYLIKKL